MIVMLRSLWFISILFVHVSICATLPNNAECCAALKYALGDKVNFPGSIAYMSSVTSYFTQQEDQLKPDCVVSPRNSKDVQTAVKTLAFLTTQGKQSCPFAIRGGGHALFSGAANINGGVTIDMRAISTVRVNEEKTVTAIGAGAKWIQVYSQLDLMGLSVLGGRVADIGVGGLITGGGMSFFAARYGFAADNVVNFEIVLSSGEIVNANATSNPGLFFSLKGGSNNFGIVTRFDVKTFQQGVFWGGEIIYPANTTRDHIQAFANLNNDPNYDPCAALIMSFGYSGAADTMVVSNAIHYTKPTINPPSLQAFTRIRPQVANTMRIGNLSGFTQELAAFNPSGQRGLYITTTFKNTVPFLNEVFDLFNATIPLIDKVAGIVYALVNQPLPPAITSKSESTGGNPLGLSGSNGPLVLCQLSVSWLDAADDSVVHNTASSLFTNINNRAKAEDLHHPWIYLNYANNTQDVINGYGATNKKKLQDASKKYDRIQLFQNSVPGGFKLFP